MISIGIYYHFHKRHSSQTRVKSNNDCISYIRELQMVVILHAGSLLGHLIGTEQLLTLLVNCAFSALTRDTVCCLKGLTVLKIAHL